MRKWASHSPSPTTNLLWAVAVAAADMRRVRTGIMTAVSDWWPLTDYRPPGWTGPQQPSSFTIRQTGRAASSDRGRVNANTGISPSYYRLPQYSLPLLALTFSSPLSSHCPALPWPDLLASPHSNENTVNEWMSSTTPLHSTPLYYRKCQWEIMSLVHHPTNPLRLENQHILFYPFTTYTEWSGLLIFILYNNCHCVG